ncbi:MAG: hypothetical protein ABJG42_24025 [Vibrio splendidus]
MVPMFIGILKDTILALLGRIAWKIIFERFFTRMVMTGLRSLVKMSTNEVVKDTLIDVADMLEGKGLSKAKEGIKK